jgi:hypothetical protein
MQQRKSHNTVADIEPQVGDLVRVTGKEWFGHPMMMSMGLIIDKQDRTGEPVECACLVLIKGVSMWIYISDLTFEARAGDGDSGTM